MCNTWLSSAPAELNSGSKLAPSQSFHNTIYTKDTCNKFHLLLVELLGCFNSSLFYLTIAWGTSENPMPGSADFKDGVVRVVTCGCVLQKLTKGAALKMHLKTISDLLLDI